MRLINADNVKDLFDVEFKETRRLILAGETHLDNLAEGFAEAARVIREMPAVDAEVVVHCKDCRYRGIIYCPAVHETMGNGLVDYTSDETYCWRGRPKEDADAT